MSEKHEIVPVWFFVGVLLLVYGVMILISGSAERPHPPETVLAELHAPVWWGNSDGSRRNVLWDVRPRKT